MVFPLAEPLSALQLVSRQELAEAKTLLEENFYTRGFEDCKRKVLAILAGHEEAMFLDTDMRNLVFGDISRLKAIE